MTLCDNYFRLYHYIIFNNGKFPESIFGELQKKQSVNYYSYYSGEGGKYPSSQDYFIKIEKVCGVVKAICNKLKKTPAGILPDWHL